MAFPIVSSQEVEYDRTSVNLNCQGSQITSRKAQLRAPLSPLQTN